MYGNISESLHKKWYFGIRDFSNFNRTYCVLSRANGLMTQKHKNGPFSANQRLNKKVQVFRQAESNQNQTFKFSWAYSTAAICTQHIWFYLLGKPVLIMTVTIVLLPSSSFLPWYHHFVFFGFSLHVLT